MKKSKFYLLDKDGCEYDLDRSKLKNINDWLEFIKEEENGNLNSLIIRFHIYRGKTLLKAVDFKEAKEIEELKKKNPNIFNMQVAYEDREDFSHRVLIISIDEEDAKILM